MYALTHAALGARPARERIPALARFALSQADAADRCPRYLAALRRAQLAELPPPCTDLYAEMYRQASGDGGWTALSLITHAERAGNEARALWSMAARADGGPARELLRRHAVARSGHATAYLSLLDLAFPGALQPDFRAQLDALSPGYAEDQSPGADGGSSAPLTLDDAIRLNLGALRAAALHTLLRPALDAYAPPENQAGVGEIMDTLLGDLLAHVAATAALIEGEADGHDPAELQRRVSRAAREHVDATSEEPIDRGYHQRFGNYP